MILVNPNSKLHLLQPHEPANARIRTDEQSPPKVLHCGLNPVPRQSLTLPMKRISVLCLIFVPRNVSYTQTSHLFSLVIYFRALSKIFSLMAKILLGLTCANGRFSTQDFWSRPTRIVFLSNACRVGSRKNVRYQNWLKHVLIVGNKPGVWWAFRWRDQDKTERFCWMLSRLPQRESKPRRSSSEKVTLVSWFFILSSRDFLQMRVCPDGVVGMS